MQDIIANTQDPSALYEEPIQNEEKKVTKSNINKRLILIITISSAFIFFAILVFISLLKKTDKKKEVNENPDITKQEIELSQENLDKINILRSNYDGIKSFQNKYPFPPIDMNITLEQDD